MPEYKVLETFRDKNTNYIYNDGDVYPHPEARKVSKKRLKELSTDQNLRKKPMIEEIPTEEEPEEIIEEEAPTEDQE